MASHCQEKGCYCRAVIEEIYMTGPEVTLYYVDYGIRKLKLINEIWGLDSNFANLPAQAIRCCVNTVFFDIKEKMSSGEIVKVYVDKVEPGGVGGFGSKELVCFVSM